MADDNKLEIIVSAKTDEFVKKVQDAQIKVKSLSQQMSEIDKQLKTESVDRVQKLSEKLELAKRASEMASKEAELYAEKIKKMTERHEDAATMTDKQKETLLKLSEQMATAQQKANTFAAEVDKLSKELDDVASDSDDAENEIEDVAEATETAATSAKEGAKGLGVFGESVLGNLASAAIQKGISVTIGLFKDLAAAAWNAAKNIASAVKDYTVDAVNLAAAYQDQVGYSEQVFKNIAEDAQKWANDNSVRLRIYKGDLLQYTNQFGALFAGFGYGEQEAMEMSKTIISLAADLRSATGKDIDSVIESLVSGFSTSTKSLQQFGVVTNEAAIKAKALDMGLVNVAVDQAKVEKASLKVAEANRNAAKALSKYGENSIEYQKAQNAVREAEEAFNQALGGTVLELDRTQRTTALLAIVLENLEYLLGQSDKESSNFSSQLDTMRTIFDNLKEEVGSKVLPVFNGFLTKFNEFIQSDEGKEFLDGIVESVGKLSDKVMEFIENGKLEEWVDAVKEKLPEITDSIIHFSEKVTELIPQVFELTEKILSLFGIKTENEKIKEAFLEVEGQIKQFAQNSGEDIDTIIKAIHAYAEANDVDLLDIYNNWNEYQPKISGYIKQITTDADGAEIGLDTALQGMTSSTQTNIESQISNWDRLKQKVQEIANFFDGPAGQKLRFFLNPTQALPELAIGRLFDHRDQGGPASAGHIYQVNDDHGLRKEMFIPSVPGYILDGNKTQSIINNSTDNSRTVGDVNVYLTSYGTNAAAISEEIGQELSKRLRMSGAW